MSFAHRGPVPPHAGRVNDSLLSLEPPLLLREKDESSAQKLNLTLVYFLVDCANPYFFIRQGHELSTS